MKEQSVANPNDSFFSGIYKEVWRKIIPAGLTEAEVDFIIDIAELKENSRLIDLMCGYGRHTLALARKGCEVTAIDSAEDYIEEIKQISRKENLPVTAEVGNVAQTRFSGSFEAAICMGNSYSFFDEAGLMRLFANVAALLQPGAKFIINTWMIAEIVFRHFRENEWYNVEEYRYLTESQLCFHPTRLEVNHIILPPSGSAQVLKGVDYIFSIAELNRMFDATGFVIKEIYYTPRKRKFQLGDTRAYIVVERISKV